jgi:hypothetical protein
MLYYTESKYVPHEDLVGDFMGLRSTVYWVEGRTRGSDTPLANQLVAYGDRLYEPTGEHSLRLESRTSGAAAVRRCGITRPVDVLNIKPAAFFEKKIKLLSYDVDRLEKALLRRTFDVERPRFDVCGDPDSPRKLINWVGAWLTEVAKTETQLLHDQLRHLRADVIPLDCLNLPTSLEFPVYGT